MISVIDGVNESVLRIMLLKNGKEVSSLSWINVLKGFGRGILWAAIFVVNSGKFVHFFSGLNRFSM